MNCFTGKYIGAVRECAATGLIFLSHRVKPFAFSLCVCSSRHNATTIILDEAGTTNQFYFHRRAIFGIFRQQAGEAQVDHVIDLGQSLCKSAKFHCRSCTTSTSNGGEGRGNSV